MSPAIAEAPDRRALWLAVDALQVPLTIRRGVRALIALASDDSNRVTVTRTAHGWQVEVFRSDGLLVAGSTLGPRGAIVSWSVQ